ncbi:SinR family protein [Burkholderia contaminans]|uniref:SinR family protein n=1 Tax=Burkholderia contaminans TaxID=488447 RepID=UPI000F561897|nr:SinR family protein [Burkholderia contaminans]
MAIHFVGYDLTAKPHFNYTNLIAAIKAYGTYWSQLDSTWLIETNQTHVQVRDNLSRHMHQNDRLLVIPIRADAAWGGSFSLKSQDWLKDVIPRA